MAAMIVILAISLRAQTNQESTTSAFVAGEFNPGKIWRDTNGQPIDAHGGGILRFNGVYYWYGELRGGWGHGAVSCYSSSNLLDWKRVWR